MIKSAKHWFIIFVLLLQLAQGNINYYNNRIVVTFYRREDNVLPFANLTSGATVVKQYGRRLVLRLPYAIIIDKVSDLYSLVDSDIDPIFIESIEQDTRISLSTPPIFPPKRKKTHTNNHNVYYQQLRTLSDKNDVSIANSFNLINLTDFTESSPTFQDDHYFQWNLADSEPFSIHAETIWKNYGYGKPNVRVAILDSGLSRVAEPAFSYVSWGFDFVSDPSISMDGDGRDLDSEDPGDIAQDCSWWPEPSWHGTKMASILAANHQTELIKGVAPNTTIMPVRVLGACGTGFANDVADAIVWASGGGINGMPLNPKPAQIISLSLAGTGPCPSYLQSAINQAISLGSIIIAAAGNDGANTTSDTFPANCVGVVSVGASTRLGNLASYSNQDANVAAPGGDYIDGIWALIPTHASAALLLKPVLVTGTSAAVPHAAGIACLFWDDIYNSDSPSQALIQEIINNCPTNIPYRLGNTTHQISKSTNSSSTVQMACNPGFYQASGYCGQCPIGQYQNGYTVATSCIPCLAGYYNTVVQSTSCPYACTAGTYCGAGAGGCTACPAGTYQPNAAQGGCEQCGIGTYSNTQAAACIACAAGTYNTLVAAPTCSKCSIGSYSTGTAITASTCPLCVAGQYNTGQGLSFCSYCPTGTYSAAGGLSACSFCASGTYSTDTAATSANTCLSCAAGKYSYIVAPNPCVLTWTLGSGTTDCSSGTLSRGGGSGAAQYYKINENYNMIIAPTFASSVTLILTRFKTEAKDKLTINQCTSTSSCTQQLLYFGGNMQAQLIPWTFVITSGIAQIIWTSDASLVNFGWTITYTSRIVPPVNQGSSCTNCPTGQYSTVVKSIACLTCASGTFTSSAAATSCIGPCVIGQYAGSACEKCASGTYNTGSGVSACSVCAGGKYSTGSGITTSNTCINCGTGVYSNFSGGHSFCTSCAAGTYNSGLGMISCISCIEGTYSPPNAASSACTACPVGTYIALLGYSACTSCASGTYASNVGSLYCKWCGAGSYISNLAVGASSICTPCPPGKYTRMLSATSASQCLDTMPVFGIVTDDVSTH